MILYYNVPYMQYIIHCKLTLQGASLGKRWQGNLHSAQASHLSALRQVEGLHHDGRAAEVLIQAEQQEGGFQHDRAALGAHGLQVPGPQQGMAA